ncbi:DUF1941-domain-containing protein [Hyaloscypha variabilis F]|uniref:DUF1941-domain-containing protein n=1 Tax=Hyaloscypha variabilis (strain UAMH 11265 / GT02V1 / F) TaxID=1149755 RepID=A0A2J6RPE1_HYAVF|nr:DUF1941-domain-containing protein [Hyaloscypha variabilis F]
MSLDPSFTIEKMKDLLQAKDDTSRFVGLALLKSVLDNGQLAQDLETLRSLWEAMSPKFFDRLLRAPQSEKVNKAESKDMANLAVAVLHTFAILLPVDSRQEKRFIARAGPLVKALLQRYLILETLLTIVSQPEGAIELLNVQDTSPLIEIASQYPLVLDVIKYTWLNASSLLGETQAVLENVDKIVPNLLVVFKGTDGVTFINFLGDCLPKLEPGTLPSNPTWLKPLSLLLQNLISRKPTAAGRAAYTKLAAALVQIFPATFPELLFKDDTSTAMDSKPFSYLFVNLFLIDLRSSFPTLLSQLNSSDYPSTSQRLAAAFDILSSFIGFLVRSLDDEGPSSGYSLPPDLLLKLRKDIAETISLTIEYLRDRWDASVAGASGLHPEARTGTAATSEGTRLTLTWESMKDNVNADPLILAGIRALAIWIREDENESLRNESAGLMDMFLELYRTVSSSSLDFRYPVLLALEAILSTEESVDIFLGQNGWEILILDLQAIIQHNSDENAPTVTSESAEANRGLQIVRVLLAVVDLPATSFPREDWMKVVTTTSAIKISRSDPSSVLLEFWIAMLQLSAALLSKAAGGMMKRYFTSHAALSGLVNQLKAQTNKIADKAEAAEFHGLLEDVALDLENLR